MELGSLPLIWCSYPNGVGTGWAQKERGIEEELRKVAEPAFGLSLPPVLQVLEAAKLVSEHVWAWRQELVLIADRQKEREFREKSVRTFV